MSSNEEIPPVTFNLIKTKVAEYFDDQGCIYKLKVLFRDHVAHQDLSRISNTMDLLNALVTSNDLSSQDLTLLYDTIKITRCFGLNLEDTLPSFPDVRRRKISRFSSHRRKIMQFGDVLGARDVTSIDGMYNTPLKHYADSWDMIYNLEHRQIIDESDMTNFVATITKLKLPRALAKLTEDLSDQDSSIALETEEPNLAMPEPADENLNQLLTVISDWWEEYGNIDMLKVVISEFNNRHKTITLDKIQETDTAFDLFQLLKGSGLIKPKKINLLVEATVLCGLQGVEDEIRNHVRLPNFSEVPIRIFSDHRRKILALGQQISRENKVRLGQLYGIKVSRDTDPWIIIFKLELKGKFNEDQIDGFIKKLRLNRMNREADALES